jgi:hypothetical protein
MRAASGRECRRDARVLTGEPAVRGPWQGYVDPSQTGPTNPRAILSERLRLK